MRDRPVRLLVVDDSIEIISVLRRGLTRSGYEVVCCADGLSAMREFRDQNPDLVILDLWLPDIDGVDLCAQLREISDTPIIMLTARDTIEDRVTGLRAGADDYMVKPFALEELSARIEAVLRRHVPGTSEITFDDLSIRLDSHRVYRSGQELSLTPTEYEILTALARRPDRVVSRGFLAATVWPDADGVDDKLLDAHIANLRRKLESSGGRRLLQTVRGYGFTLR